MGKRLVPCFEIGSLKKRTSRSGLEIWFPFLLWSLKMRRCPWQWYGKAEKTRKNTRGKIDNIIFLCWIFSCFPSFLRMTVWRKFVILLTFDFPKRSTCNFSSVHHQLWSIPLSFWSGRSVVVLAGEKGWTLWWILESFHVGGALEEFYVLADWSRTEFKRRIKFFFKQFVLRGGWKMVVGNDARRNLVWGFSLLELFLVLRYCRVCWNVSSVHFFVWRSKRKVWDCF